jgi:hypothetical protein
MLFIVLVEGAGWVMSIKRVHNHWLYNIELVAESGFLAWVFWQEMKAFGIRKIWTLTGLFLFFAAFIIEGSRSGFRMYTDKADTLFSVLAFLGSGIYFYLLLKYTDYIDLYKHPGFWLMAGIFLFYFSSIAFELFFSELLTINIAGGLPLRYIVFTILNAILYGCWSYSFRCRYLKTISSVL